MCSKISLKSLSTTSALRVSNFGDLEDRLVMMHGLTGVKLQGVTSSLLSAVPIAPHIDITSALLGLPEEESAKALAMLRGMREERARDLFRSALSKSDDEECFEGAFGLCAIGVNDADRLHLKSALESQDDQDRKSAILTALFVGDLLQGVLEESDLDTLTEELPLIEPLVDILEDDDPSALIEFTQSGVSWQSRICAYYILGHLAPRLASHEYLNALLECFNEDDDGDAYTMLMYSIGQVVRHLGCTAVERVLKFAISDLGSGSRKQCILINAAYRAVLTSEETVTVNELITSFDESDSDTQCALGRVLNVFLGECNLGHWLFQGHYGRGYDLYDPFYHDRGFLPQEVWSICVTGECTRTDMVSWLRMVSDASLSHEFSALSTSLMLDKFPEISPLLERFINDQNGSDSIRSGIATALLFSGLAEDLSPIYLRCLLNCEHTGGPIVETPEVLGELLYYSSQSETELVACELLRGLSATGRATCAGFLRASLREERYNDSRERLLFSLGFPAQSTPTPTPKPTSSLDLRLALNQEVSQYELGQFIAQANDKTRGEVVRSLLESLKGHDRSRALAIARDATIWRGVPIEQLQSHILHMSRGAWVQREVCCAFAYTLGSPVVSGALGVTIREMIQRLCNDNDSDVSHEARRAAKSLELEVLIINMETLRDGILESEGSTREEWIERLYLFIKSEDERNDILNLCRNRMIWPLVDQDDLSTYWIELADGGWIGREAAAVLATNHDALLLGTRAEEIRSRILELSRDDDDDVKREAKTACVMLGLE